MVWQTFTFSVILVVKKGANFPRKFVPLQLYSDPQLSDIPQDPLKYMALTNIVSSLALNKSGKPWRGNQEISNVLFQILIEMCSKPNQIVVNISASTGASACACKASGRHFFGLKADREIYEVLLNPYARLLRLLTNQMMTTCTQVSSSSESHSLWNICNEIIS